MIIKTKLMKSIIQFFVLFILSISISFAQKEPKDHEIKEKEILQQVKLADNKMDDHSYYDAIDLYVEILQKVPDNVYVHHRLAMAYFTARDYENAEKHFGIAIANKDHHFPEDYFYYGEALQMQGKYIEALKEFQLFAKQKSKDPHMKLLKKYIKQEKRSCNYALRIIDQDTAFAHVDLMPKGINHSYSDFAPMPLGHDTLIFAARMEDSIISYTKGDRTFHPVRLYQSIREEGMNWSEPEKLEMKKLDNKYEHTANGTYSLDNQRFYFTRCTENPSKGIVCHIYMSKKEENGNWSKPKKLPKINKAGYTSTQPTVESYVKKKRKKVTKYDILYFSSNQPKGKGGLDIWFTAIDEKGNVREPINLGTKVNTIRDEVTPFYDDLHKTLYFSSNYHYSLGGFDVQKSKGSQKRWAKPENVGIPVNSSYDDTYYHLETDTTTDKEIGYIVSNRPGGFALKSPTCCDDIYHFDYYEPEKVPLQGIISEKKILNDSSKTTLLADVRVGYVRTHYIEQAKVNDKIDYNIIAEHVTWADTSKTDGEYHVNIIKEKSYGLVVLKEGYITPQVYELDSLIKAEPDGMHFNIELEKILTKKDSSLLIAQHDSLTIQDFHSNLDAENIKENTKFVLKNVYFDTDKSRLQSESYPALKLLLTFMLKHPNVKIEVSGHTDSHGSDEHNKKLSQNRAEAVRHYLLENGVEQDAVTAVGYGEEQPIAKNENADGSDNPEGRKLNRRTEVKVLSNNVSDEIEYDHSEFDHEETDDKKEKS